MSANDSITVQALAAWRTEGVAHVVLDVREDDELAICALEGAIHIPMGQVPARLGELPRDKPIVVMCHHGMRSLRVMQFLRRAGRPDALNLEGGIDAWAWQVDPSVSRY